MSLSPKLILNVPTNCLDYLTTVVPVLPMSTEATVILVICHARHQENVQSQLLPVVPVTPHYALSVSVQTKVTVEHAR